MIKSEYEGILKYMDSNIETRQWGKFRVIENFLRDGKNIKIKYLYIEKDKNISYQFHNFREETWFVLSGKGQVIKGRELIYINQGDYIHIERQQLHTIRADEDMEIVEIQAGSKNEEDDIERIEKDWDKIIKATQE